ncbi:MAG: PSD1 and planctomycete cytochrome C domain-containing protein [Planctomycetaceae bacterium]
MRYQRLLTHQLATCVVVFAIMCGLPAAAFGAACTTFTSEEEAPAATFESHIRPILSSRCGKCHSETVQKGELNLATMSDLRRGGESGESLIAETVGDSLLWIMIESGSMPPEGEPPLANDERLLIQQWLREGAKSAERTESIRVTQHDVLPIVLLRCAACHGARLQQGGVDMRSVASMKAGGKSGPVLIAGDAGASRMMERIETEACPPRDQLLKYFVKRPSAGEVDTLRKWINEGAVEYDIQPDIATNEPDPSVTDEDRTHWAFRAPVTTRTATSIDDFILPKLQAAGLQFSPRADRDTLIRRACLDLTGLPPTVEEWRRWREMQDEDWFSQLVDHLLESPRYGERWGRYWLDVAGYADSEGGVSADPVREVAWKYRDYVIRSFNADKPYDRFLLEQLAGDELQDCDAASAEDVTEQMVDNLIATGFLRMGIDQTGSRTMNFVPERLGVINDAIAVLGSGVLGLTLECARCHSHKYDPIPQRDYYRLKAVFQGAYDEHDWLTFRNRAIEFDTAARRKRVAEVNPPLLAQLKKLKAQLAQAETVVKLQLLREHYPEQKESDRQETLQALRIADNNRSLPQRVLVEMLQSAEIIPDHLQPETVKQARRQVADFNDQIEAVQLRLEPPLRIRALWDRGEPSPTYVLRRGEHEKPGPLVGPGVPMVLTDGKTPFVVEPPFPDGTPKTGRRLALARWLVQPNHPLTARVIVNRIWFHHFGSGIVRSLENFGVKGDRPTHPELLDWLALTFVEQDAWHIKSLHRRLMNSRTYQQASLVTQQHLDLDPQNHLLSRMNVHRMDAEAIRDSFLAVSGRLDLREGGPPDFISVDHDGLVSTKPTADGHWRRSVYLQYRRTEIPSLMATFDYPVMGPNCVNRSQSTVSLQALMLSNGQQLHQLAASFADRILEATSGASSGLADEISRVYQMALSRLPDDEEMALGMSALKELETAWGGDHRRALATFCHTILNSAEFLYVD